MPTVDFLPDHWDWLPKNDPRFSFTTLDTCDSTNTSLLKYAEAGAVSGSVLITKKQLLGRGRRGRQWLSASGKSLTFSLLWHFPDPQNLSGLSLAVGLGLWRALSFLGAQNILLKWPNDLLWQAASAAENPKSWRKMAGILVEVTKIPTPKKTAVIIGIGLNLNAPTGLDVPAAGLLESLSLTITPTALLQQILHEMAWVLDTMQKTSFAPLAAEWNLHHAFQEKNVRIHDEQQEHIGLCKGVDAEGCLLLQRNGKIERVTTGDLSLCPAGMED